LKQQSAILLHSGPKSTLHEQYLPVVSAPSLLLSTSGFSFSGPDFLPYSRLEQDLSKANLWYLSSMLFLLA